MFIPKNVMTTKNLIEYGIKFGYNSINILKTTWNKMKKNMDMKYISYDNGMYDDIVIFSSSRSHQEMVDSLNIKKEDLLGAGFISMGDGKFYCHGRSTTLGLNSRPNDSKIINKFMKLETTSAFNNTPKI